MKGERENESHFSILNLVLRDLRMVVYLVLGSVKRFWVKLITECVIFFHMFSFLCD